MLLRLECEICLSNGQSLYYGLDNLAEFRVEETTLMLISKLYTTSNCLLTHDFGAIFKQKLNF